MAVQQCFAVSLTGSEMAGSDALNMKNLDALSCLCYLSVDVRLSVYSQDPEWTDYVAMEARKA